MAQGMSCHFARRSLFSVDPVKLLRLFQAFCLLLFQISDIRKIPVLLIEVQSITYDKPVIYGKSYIIHIDILRPSGLSRSVQIFTHLAS